jgi:enamine deaminase RidA (YjgF/YER057c/UK114 family)
MMQRHRAPSDSPYASTIGFSRAVKIGNLIAVGGTAPIGPDGKTVGHGDAAAQARCCFETALAALATLGATPADVIRTRCYLTRIEDWEAVGKVHGELFSKIRPASTIVQVAGFVRPEWLVEVEVDAVVSR